MDNKDFWLRLIIRSNEETQTPTRIWNLFQRWVLENLDDISFPEHERNSLLDIKKKQDLLTLTREEINALGFFIHHFDNLKDSYKQQINFLNCQFDKPVVFSDAQFYLSVNFNEATFSERVYFRKATFSGLATFNNATFSELAFFNNATFSELADFNNAEFSENAVFNNAEFSKEAFFESATFSKEAFFRSAEFLENAVFDKATFSGWADFDKATFSGWAFFNNATFSELADFNNATFSKMADFNNATFSELADFNNATFSELADFNNATFSELADFNKATFSELADFNDVTFSKAAHFTDVIFSKGAKFYKATFSEHADFKDLNKIDNTNNKTSVSLDFTKTTFKKHPPETFESSLHESSSFLNVFWPEADKNTAETNIHAYERLLIQVGTLGMVDTRNTLIQKELECYAIIAKRTDAFWRKTYGRISNHGTSIDKPLFILVLLFVGVNLIWLPKIYLARTENFTFWDTFWDIIGFNFNKALPFTKMSGYQTDAFISFIQEAPPCLIALSSTLSIVSPIFLFLVGLGLRSKFRLSL